MHDWMNDFTVLFKIVLYSLYSGNMLIMNRSVTRCWKCENNVWMWKCENYFNYRKENLIRKEKHVKCKRCMCFQFNLIYCRVTSKICSTVYLVVFENPWDFLRLWLRVMDFITQKHLRLKRDVMSVDGNSGSWSGKKTQRSLHILFCFLSKRLQLCSNFGVPCNKMRSDFTFSETVKGIC